ncbi:MAG: BREX-2 system adenine-specific DNA-methyltransferase PglX [Candidatus Eisenbacteria bacterium]|nr:BREX-2 system adenine-specific DNA-methyltransferase PglX [Candidatus Eisenbacteria bacterium]
MIDRKRLLTELKPQVRALERDLKERATDAPFASALEQEYERARGSERTAETFETWRNDRLTQMAVAWALACVFVRFLEDNQFLEHPWIAGPGERLEVASHRQALHFQERPKDSDRDWLERAFTELATHDDLRPLFGREENPLWLLPISGDAAQQLIAFFRRIDPGTGTLAHDFVDPQLDTRFLGDLYQDLSDDAKKRYALLQTPEFIEEFILDRTLTPAIDQFGYAQIRLLDPTCGSGHFLLGGFQRLLRLWDQHHPGLTPAQRVQRALDSVSGVDLNPFATAIARFRLLIAALRGADIHRLDQAPSFTFQLATGDSLLHGRRFSFEKHNVAVQLDLDPKAPIQRHFSTLEDARALNAILGRQYHVVVGNPPYITVKDKALNQAYRQLYPACHMKYSLVVPFLERFFDLALSPADPAGTQAGHIGLIAANSFMKREFGRKLIEQMIPTWDLTHIIDTSGAYIPGHGTPTVILFGRNRAPVSSAVRVVQGIRGEPQAPAVPAHGQVWQSILTHLDLPGSQTPFISVVDQSRPTLSHHPWSIGGGGAAELKELIEAAGTCTLGSIASHIGITSVTGEDDLYMLPDAETARRLGIESTRPLVTGDIVRDWAIGRAFCSLWTYDKDFDLETLIHHTNTARLLWRYRTGLSKRKRFGTPMLERGLTWYEWQELYADKLRTPLSITFAEVATHNHFVLDRGGKVFNRTAPVIKLPAGATEEDHLGILGLLNSSTACFWLRQVCFPKGGDQVGDEGARVRKTMWEVYFAFNAANLSRFPIPTQPPTDAVTELTRFASARETLLPGESACAPTASDLAARARGAEDCLEEMIFQQEELDWRCYRVYGLTELALESGLSPSAAGGLRPGQRAFEIVMARRMAEGELETTWFERHGATPITEIPEEWPEEYRRVVERRIELIETDRNIALIEQPECKRRWNVEPWEELEERALREWLLGRMEDSRYWERGKPRLRSVGAWADELMGDGEFRSVLGLWAGREDLDGRAATKLIAELVEGEGVPGVAALRYRELGLEKRAQWERTWELQRREDAIEARSKLSRDDPRWVALDDVKRLIKEEVGTIPVPPKYGQADFASGTVWRLRGKLDVPKERFVLYPFASRDADPTLVLTWAGFDALDQALGLSIWYEERRTNDGWPAERLAPLLLGVLELMPWVKQWHGGVHPVHGQDMAEYMQGFVDEELRRWGWTEAGLRGWKPAAAPRGAKRRS